VARKITKKFVDEANLVDLTNEWNWKRAAATFHADFRDNLCLQTRFRVETFQLNDSRAGGLHAGRLW